MSPIARYAAATLAPAAFILIAGTAGGILPFLAFLMMFGLSFLLDQLLDPPEPVDGGIWSDRLATGLAIAHLTVLVVVLAQLTGTWLGYGQKTWLLLAAASWMGQVSHPNAHELIHRPVRRLRALGAAVYLSMLFGHHLSAHRLVHHRDVGTPADPATPEPGESFWTYVTRAWPGGILAGFDAEADLLEARGDPVWSPGNPYWLWGAGALAALVLAGLIAGAGGVLTLLTIAALFHLQVMMSDYVQHYGLQRLVLPGGGREPIGPHHSWNAPRGFSSLMMMNAPSHSEHHMHPGRGFDRLDPRCEGPRLPYSLPAMAAIACIPPMWHSLMDKRALRVMEAAEARLAETAEPDPENPGTEAAAPVEPADLAPRPGRAAPASRSSGDAADPTEALVARTLATLR